MQNTFRILVVLLCYIALHPVGAGAGVYLREEFHDLERWKHFTFPSIKKHTQYSVKALEGRDILEAFSRESASALYLKQLYNVYDYPILRWMWRVDDLYERARPHTRRGDDYPLRIYVMFQYDPENTGFFRKIQIKRMRDTLGEHIPVRSLCYVWAGSAAEGAWFQSPYFGDESMTLVKRAGAEQLGQWFKEEVNVLEDYRRAFGHQPPSMAWVAIMNDSDNTKDSGVSYVDWLEIGPVPAP